MINCLLNRTNGSGMPQVVLDHLALRFECADYQRLFGRAVAAWSTTESGPTARHQDRMRKRQLLDQLVAQLDASKAETESASLSNDNPEAARLALLVDV